MQVSKKSKATSSAVTKRSARGLVSVDFRLPPPASIFKVKSTSTNGIYRTATVENRYGRETRVKMHKGALIGPSDSLYFDPANSARVFIVSSEDQTDLIQVTPVFERRRSLRLGEIEYEIFVRELTTKLTSKLMNI